MFTFVLLSGLPFLTQGTADFVGVLARQVYPPVPFGRPDTEFGPFMAKWGSLPPWHSFSPQVKAKWGPYKYVHGGKVDGVVVDVSAKEEFIEIRKKGEEGTVKYPAHYLLASGRVVAWESDGNSYLLEDVKKGDEVGLCVGTVDQDRGEECFYIRIRKRPDGRVPPPRKLTSVRLYHLDRQAEIDHAEKGTPLPEHLRPKPNPPKAPKPAPPPADPKK